MAILFEIKIQGSNGNEIIQKYIDQIYKDTLDWGCEGINKPWFRGQSDSKKPPIPVIFRKNHNGKNGSFNEFWLSTTFRNRAPNFGVTPENRDDIDKWLFLMRHMELPTRLLDWSESAIVALFMATNAHKKNKNPAVWMINPIALNLFSLQKNIELNQDTLKKFKDAFPNTWTKNSPALENIRLAFRHPDEGFCGYKPTELPLAIQLTFCHSRMSAQKGCFTVYGIKEDDFETLFNNEHELVTKGYFKKYIFDSKQRDSIYKELQNMGITHSSVYPDLIGLSNELKDRFFY